MLRRIQSECVPFGGVDEGCKVFGIMVTWEVLAACFDFTLHRKGEVQVYALAYREAADILVRASKARVWYRDIACPMTVLNVGGRFLVDIIVRHT